MSRAPSWKIADLIDFEFLLAGDEGEEGREFFAKNVAPKLEPGGAGDRRTVFKMWLEARRGDAGKWPGSRCAAAGQAVASLGLLVGLLLGASVTVGLLHYQGDEPVNVAWFFAGTVGVQMLLLAAAAGLWLVRRVTRVFDEWHPLRDLLSALAWALAAGLRKLPGAERARLRAALAVLGRKQEIYGSLAAWPFLITTQIFAVAYNVGILAVLVAHVAMVDLAFAWQSTLHLGPEAAHRLVSALAAPWAWAVSNAHPTLAEIAASRFSYSEGLAPLDRAALVSWWPFLGYAVVFYGLLLRGVLLVLGCVKLRTALRSLAFDHEGCNALFRRLTGPVMAAQDGTARLEIPGVAAPLRAHAGRGGECVALVAADVELPANQPADYLGATFGWRVREARPAQIDHPSGNAEALAALAGGAPLASVVVVVRARRSPIKAIALFMQSVTERAGPTTEVVLLLVGRKEGAGFAPVDEAECAHWRNFRAIHGLRVSLEKWSAA